MLRTSIFLWLALAGTSSALADAQPTNSRYWSDTWRGWHFYEEPADEREDPPKRTATAPKPPPSTKPARAPELVEFERLQKSLETRRHIAIMNPTETNVRQYMEIEARVVAQASAFADVAQRVAWASPQLDPSLQGRPVNARALEVFEQQQRQERAGSIAALASDHVLIFFFRGDCPYCHAFAPTLDAFRSRHGLQVLAVSLDGGTLPGFADARRDNGIAGTLKVGQVPALYLAQPFTGKISPIGFGVLSESQLSERITTVAATPAETVPLRTSGP